MWRNLKRIFTSLVTNPLVLIGYWIFCYELASLSMYGRINNNVFMLGFSIVILISLITFTTIKIMRDKELKPRKSMKLKAWKYISIVIIVVITLFYGMSIYKSAVNYGGKLAWFIDRLKNEASVELEHQNIYIDGVEGIFEDINKEYDCPPKRQVLKIV